MTFGDIIVKFGQLLDAILPFLMSLGVIIFVWGVIMYVISNEEEAKTKGRDRMIWGIIGFTAIVGLWGLVNIVVNTFGLDQGVIPSTIVPATPTQVGPCREPIENLGDALCKAGYLINSIIPVMIGLGVIIFVWGVVIYVIGGDEEAKTKGRDRMLWGIIGLAVIASLWGLVTIVVNTFSLGGGSGVASEFLEQTGRIGGASTSCELDKTDTNVGDVMGYATCLITKSVIPLILALGVLMFVWGVIQYVISGANEEQKDKGKQYMIWGIIALAVMVSVWGIVKILGATFGIDYAIPQVKSK